MADETTFTRQSGAIWRYWSNRPLGTPGNFGTADRGLCRGTISATLRGDFGRLSATGKSATAPIAEIVRIADGQIVEAWVYPDTLSIMQQFGLIATSDCAQRRS